MDFFFFQAEDGIRDSSVTGVQTCALPISTGTILLRGQLDPVRFAVMNRRGRRDACALRSNRRRDRKSVVSGKSVDLGGRRIIEKKKTKALQNREARRRTRRH